MGHLTASAQRLARSRGKASAAGIKAAGRARHLWSMTAMM